MAWLPLAVAWDSAIMSVAGAGEGGVWYLIFFWHGLVRLGSWYQDGVYESVSLMEGWMRGDRKSVV